MAFTDAQRRDIRHYLGFPDVFRDSNPRLESAMDVIGGREEVAAKAVALLGDIAAAMAELGPLASLQTEAALKKVESIEFFGGANDSGTVRAAEMRKTGRMLVGQLSILMGVPVAHDVFSGGGYQDDSWGGSGFQVGGGLIPLG